MITIDQLLESVDLDFEPRWVTKNKNGGIYVWATRPHYRSGIWFGDESVDSYITKLKLAEFEGKSSDECIYEVPRNDVDYEKIKLGMEETGKQLDKISAQLDTIRDLMAKRGLIKVDAVNELKGAKNENTRTVRKSTISTRETTRSRQRYHRQTVSVQRCWHVYD